MVAPQIFKVLTEFKFEIGSALLGTRKLTDNVNALSGAADNAISTFQSLGVSVASSLGLVGGGFLTTFSTAISASEKFRNSQLSFATIISANKEKLTGSIDTFNERLGVSSTIIKDIVSQANKFALDERSLLNITKLLSAQLSAKGLAGDNFEVAIDLGRNLLKAAPLLGLDPALIEGQLLRTIEGTASLGDTLFRRLVSETDAFGQFGGKGGGAKKFNVLPATQRLDLLRKALGQFTNDTQALEQRVNSLTGQLSILRNLFSGLGSILVPLGNTLKAPLIKILKEVNIVINTQGRRIATNFAKLLAPIIEDPKKLVVNLLQMRSLQRDIFDTKKAVTFAGAIGTLGFILSKITGVVSLANPLIATFGIVFSSMITLLGRVLGPLIDGVGEFLNFVKIPVIVFGIAAAIFGVGTVLTGLGIVLKTILLPLAGVLVFFQLLSRAAAIAQLSDAKAIPELAANLSDAFVRIEESVLLLISPFTQLFDTLASIIAPLFSVTITGNLLLTFLQTFAAFLEKLTTVVVGSLAAISASFEAFFATLLNVQETFASNSILDFLSGEVGIGDIFGGVGDAFEQEFARFVTSVGPKAGEPGGNALVQSITNIGTQKVEISNSFKEQQEPDRIAFTIKDQLMKLAQNPTQSKGRAISTGLTTAPGAGT